MTSPDDNRATRAPRSWDEIYTVKGEDGVSWFQESAGTSLAMIERAGLSPSASFVDVGAGASRLADDLIQRGWHDLTVVDISPVGLDRIQERLAASAVQPAFIVADLLAWSPSRQYDVWHDRAVFHFLASDQERASYLATVKAATHPGSTLVIATFAEDGPTQCSGRPTCRYSADELAAEFAPAFVLVDSEREAHRTPSGAEQSFTWVVLRRD